MISHRRWAIDTGPGIASLLAVALLALPLAVQGRDFPAARNISHSPRLDYAQHLAVAGTSLYAAWLGVEQVPLPGTGCCTNGDWDVFFARSDDSGRTFSPPVNLSELVGDSAFDVQVAALGSAVYVVWTDNDEQATGPGQVYVARSGDGGKTFLPPLNVSNTAQGSASPKIAVDPTNGNVYVVWGEYGGNMGVFFSHSDDDGATFAAAQILSPPGRYVIGPGVAVDGSGAVHVVWSELVGPQDEEIMYRRSVDGGSSFLPARNLSNSPGFSTTPKVQTNGELLVCVVWQESTGGLLAATSGDGGGSFPAPVTVAEGTDLHSPSLAISPSGTIHVAWANQFVDGTVFSSHSVDGGGTFSDPVGVLLSAKIAYDGNIAVGSAASVFVAWEIRTTDDGNSLVFLAESRDGGETFASQDLTRAPATRYENAMGPEVAVDASSVFVTWAGGPFRSDVFFTRSPE